MFSSSVSAMKTVSIKKDSRSLKNFNLRCILLIRNSEIEKFLKRSILYLVSLFIYFLDFSDR